MFYSFSMKALFATLLMLFAVPVAAQDFDAPKAAHMAYEARDRCRNTDDLENATDDPVACRARDTLWIIMQVHGYCWDRGEQVFVLCSDPNPERPENKAVYR